MSGQSPRDPFFVGYLNAVPRALVLFSILAAAAFAGGMVGLAFAISAGVDDPGDGRFAFDLGYQTYTGILEVDPYPLLHVPPDADHPQGRTIMLSGEGKNGIQGRTAGLDGTLVDAGGILLKRGALDMLQVGGEVGLRVSAAATGFQPPPAISLGRWRLTGEVCDGKCYTGAMRPGSGLAHKACANLCLLGGVPPVFVSAGPVEGTPYFLMADPAGKSLPDGLYDKVALLIEVEGEVERRGSLLVFKVDLSGARTP
ncbi:MAG: hypothetical protein ACTS3R_12200 [Inquilinaceae bacterium]